MKKRKKTNTKKRLSLATIEAATSGDVDAIYIVLKHFEGYMIHLSSAHGYDEDIHSRLKIKLISRLASINTNLL